MSFFYNVQLNVFQKFMIEYYLVSISFGTFYVQIGRFFKAQCHFELSEKCEIGDIFVLKQGFDPFSAIFKDSL